ncbi:MAG: hypothetical protein HYX51_01720 [Chloroflexi bacterium]|nr:hypothetical protein [Chloroflexota bacterium]
MTGKSLWEHQHSVHRRAEVVLNRLFDNQKFIAQIQAGLEASERGERGTPLREIQEQERRRRAEG